MSFASGEKSLSAWMACNASVAWLEHPEPWLLEREAIDRLDLPLNLQHNIHHPFGPILRQIRKAAKVNAEALPRI
jgi:hypothetical protein